MIDAAGEDMPHGTWSSFLVDIIRFLDNYHDLKRHHGPQAFRAILKAFLDKADYTRRCWTTPSERPWGWPHRRTHLYGTGRGGP